MKTLNMHIAGFCEKVNRFVEEVERDRSSSLDDTSTFLLDRMNEYYSFMVDENKKMSLDTQIESVETEKPVFHEIPQFYKSGKMKNRYNKTCCILLETICYELFNSQSANREFGLKRPDSIRNLNLIIAFKRYFDGIKNIGSLDLPRTTDLIREEGAKDAQT